MLQEELQQDAEDDKRGDDVWQREEAEADGRGTEGEQRDVGESLGVQAGEDAEVVAVARRGVRRCV